MLARFAFLPSLHRASGAPASSDPPAVSTWRAHAVAETTRRGGRQEIGCSVRQFRPCWAGARAGRGQLCS
eukprot:1792967-Pyramimonas_sp.AAC.1